MYEDGTSAAKLGGSAVYNGYDLSCEKDKGSMASDYCGMCYQCILDTFENKTKMYMRTRERLCSGDLLYFWAGGKNTMAFVKMVAKLDTVDIGYFY